MVALCASTLLASILAAGGGAGDVVCLDFYSPQCGPCRQMDPIVARLASYGAPFRKVDVTREPHVAQQFGVRSLPTFILLVNGQEVDRIVGACSIVQLGNMLKKAQTAGAGIPGEGPPTGRPSLVASPIVPPSRDPFLARGTPAELPPAAPETNAAPPAAVPYQPVPYQPVPYQPAPSAPAPYRLAAAPEPYRPAAAPASMVSQPLPAHLRGGALESPNPNLATASAPAAAIPVAQGMSPAERAMAATVRLKVEDPTGFSYGTGTVIHTHDHESLIITCGHIFRDSKGQGPINVDIFGQRATVQGKLLHCDLDRDVALVTIRTNSPLSAAPVARANRDPRIGERVFSIGCNHGQDPTVIPGQVTQTASSRVTTSQGEAVYLVEVSGKPVDGRSGGGLFSAEGELLGICNFADRTADRGFYASAATVRRALDDGKLAFVYQQPPATQPSPRAMFASNPPAAAAPVAPAAYPLTANPVAASPGHPAGAPPVGVLTGPLAGLPPGAQVICLVRGPADPNGRYSLYVLEQPSHSFLEQLAKESRNQQGEPTTLRIER